MGWTMWCTWKKSANHQTVARSWLCQAILRNQKTADKTGPSARRWVLVYAHVGLFPTCPGDFIDLPGTRQFPQGQAGLTHCLKYQRAHRVLD
jgi:hypothetical protein